METLKKKQALEDDDGEDGAKYAEESDMGRQQSTATRQLRIREDTAKYLLNLDLDSAKYDPKTRSMVDSGATADTAAALVAEEGFMRASGDAGEFEKAQRYAWESQEKGDTKLHLQANPTSGEVLRRKERQEAEVKKEAHKRMLLEKYGGDVNPNAARLRSAAIVESERYVEYDESGAVKGALAPAKSKSKYPEDVLMNNHTSVWGSFWADFQWGFQCCHSTIRNSYCTGAQGKVAFEDADRLRNGGDLVVKDIAWKEPEKLEPLGKKREREETQDEELEEWKKRRVAADDPMAKLLGTDQLVQ